MSSLHLYLLLCVPAMMMSSVGATVWSLPGAVAANTNLEFLQVLHSAEESQRIILDLQAQTLEHQEAGQATRGRFTDAQINSAVLVLKAISARGGMSTEEYAAQPIALAIVTHTNLAAGYKLIGGRFSKKAGRVHQKPLTIADSTEIYRAVKTALEKIGGSTGRFHDILDYVHNVLGLHIPRTWIEALFYTVNSSGRAVARKKKQAPLVATKQVSFKDLPTAPAYHHPIPVSTPGPPAPVDTPKQAYSTPIRNSGSVARVCRKRTPRGPRGLRTPLRTEFIELERDIIGRDRDLIQRSAKRDQHARDTDNAIAKNIYNVSAAAMEALKGLAKDSRTERLDESKRQTQDALKFHNNDNNDLEN